MTFERREISIAGNKLPTLVAGKGNPIIYIQCGDGSRQGEILVGLSKDRQVYVPLLPGLAAGEPINGERPLVKYADLISGLIEQEVGQACDVIGNSFGATIAASLAARHSEKVDHLILQSPTDNAPEGCVLASDAGKELTAALAQIGAVTLILSGSRDEEVAGTYIQSLKAAIRKSYLIYVYDAGHDIEADQPQRLRQVLSDFLEWGEGFLVNRRDQRVSVWPRAEQIGHA